MALNKKYQKLSWHTKVIITYCVILFIALILVIITTAVNKHYWNKEHADLVWINHAIENKDSDLDYLSDKTLSYVHPFFNDSLIDENLDKISMEKNYRKAMDMYEKGNYLSALSAFVQNPSYRDSKSYILELFEFSKRDDTNTIHNTDSGYKIIYNSAKSKIENNDYEGGVILLEIISDYKDSNDLINECKEKLQKEKM